MFLSLLLCWVLPRSALGEVVGAVVMPHGGIALDPTHFKTSDKQAMSEAWSLHDASKLVGRLVGSWEPDILLLSTPHGLADLTQFSFYLNSKGYGSADTDNCNCPPCCYNVSVDMNVNSSRMVISKLKGLACETLHVGHILHNNLQLIKFQAVGANVSGVVGYGDAEPFPLRWGEVIPLHFLLPALPATTRSLILSQPNRRYTQSVEMIPELLALGNGIFSILEPLKERVAVVISADLAHTHLASGPYGYSNASEPFDQAVGAWASTLNSTALLVSAASLVDRALSCGYTGLVMLQGIMEARGLKMWEPKLYANYHPSYYGMIVAAFQSH